MGAGPGVVLGLPSRWRNANAATSLQGCKSRGSVSPNGPRVALPLALCPGPGSLAGGEGGLSGS